ncbi:MAG: hypothetical protein PHI76_03405 [Clostridia bacterium]|nr:hypothetical protein [Clostridia bacterium]
MKLKKIILSFLISICVLSMPFLSGCLFLDFIDFQDYAPGEITSFKACYRAEGYELDNTISKYANLVTDQLYANFGILNDNEHPSKIADKPDKAENSNYDKIRVQTQYSEINKGISWKWSFSQNAEPQSLSTSEGATEYYLEQSKQDAYYNEYVPVYSIAMEIVLYEIMMNKTPTIFTIDINQETGSTKVYYDTSKTKEIIVPTETEQCVALNDTRAEFLTKGLYIGLTINNVQILNNYILNNIIGDEIINSPYDTIKYKDKTQSLNYVVQQILTLEPELNQTNETKSIYSPYPMSYIKDFTGSKLYINSNSSTALEHIPALEYQSVVIMPDDDIDSYLLISLAFECEYDITINASLNYYNGSAEPMKSYVQNDIFIKAGIWTPEDMSDFYIDNSYKINSFNQPNIFRVEQTVVNNSTGLANYYNITDNSKIGILNNGKINQPYFEFTFEIEKDTSKDYFPFKVGVVSVWNG